jgi:hypothetical protein
MDLHSGGPNPTMKRAVLGVVYNPAHTRDMSLATFSQLIPITSKAKVTTVAFY